MWAGIYSDSAKLAIGMATADRCRALGRMLNTLLERVVFGEHAVRSVTGAFSLTGGASLIRGADPIAAARLA